MTTSNVADLIRRFNDNRPDYEDKGYKEARLRAEFIDPLFIALGWDVYNTAGYAEAYKDVIHEDSIRVSGATKAPDYAFRIGGARKFFVEAKAANVDITRDAEASYQIRRYGWSAKLPISILTNFQHLAVYDCRIKPAHSDRPSAARILLFSLEEYESRWEELASLFSREAILKGAFDRFAKDVKRKRGTGEVDSAFLVEIESWRESLARNIALRNPEISVRDLNTAVQRIIDRIIFLRIAEDRGIEQYGRLREAASNAPVYSSLVQLFRKADSRYNSGLFHFDPTEGNPETVDRFTTELKIDDKVLRPIIGQLYYPESPYEFSVLPADILGQIYEQFIGKVIRLKGKSAVVEDKPEVLKAGGIYYTPTHIVRHIIDLTVRPALEGKTPGQLAGTDRRVKKPAPLRILDPACGSGSFLIETYQYLLDWYRDQYIADGAEKHSKARDAKLYQAERGAWRLTIAEKRRILLDHIYGVDVDPQAVEVTKLSLLLKVLEGESSDAVASQMDFFKLRALPDLGDNIVCGNTLIDHRLYSHYSRDLFSLDERLHINCFDWHQAFKFLEDTGGFDVVIGNPPYLYSAGQEQERYFTSVYSYAQYQTDFFVYFIERAIWLLRNDGRFSFIIPDSWMNSDNIKRIRDYLVQQNRLDHITVFRYFVFKKASIENTVVVARKGGSTDSIDVCFSSAPTMFGASRTLRRGDIDAIGFIDPYFSKKSRDLIERLSGYPPLESEFELNRGLHAYRTDGFGQSRFGSGHQTQRDKNERSYHSAQPLDQTYLPEIRGRDVGWLEYKYSGQYLSYGPWLAEPRDPKFMMRPKVVARKTLGPILSCALIREPAAVDQALYIAISKTDDEAELLQLLGILGSAVGAWFLRTKFGIYDLLHPWYTKAHLAEFPLPGKSATLVSLVQSVLDAKKRLSAANGERERRLFQADIDQGRRDINECVYQLYHFTDAERAVVESDATGSASPPEDD